VTSALLRVARVHVQRTQVLVTVSIAVSAVFGLLSVLVTTRTAVEH
jgi:hypothetical protein